MKKRSKLHLVIFDLDGVLVDACEWHRLALNEALKEVCHYEIAIDDHYSDFNGLPTLVKLNKLVSLGKIRPEDIPVVSALKQAKTIEIINRDCRKDKSKIELIDWLKQNRIHVACYTNSIRQTAELMLEKIGVKDKFEMILTNQDVIRPKPDPEGYEETIEEFSTYYYRTMIVEDSPKGIQAAKSSGGLVFEVENAKQVTKENVERFINENFNSYGR